jgi:hypothetical protein
MKEARWYDLGPVEDLARRPVQQITVGRTKIALTFQDGRLERSRAPAITSGVRWASRELAGRAIEMAKILLTTPYEPEHIAHAGRKGCQGTAPESPAMVAAGVEG